MGDLQQVLHEPSPIPIAHRRYDGEGGWTLYFGDRYGHWTMHYHLEPTGTSTRS